MGVLNDMLAVLVREADLEWFMTDHRADASARELPRQGLRSKRSLAKQGIDNEIGKIVQHQR